MSIWTRLGFVSKAKANDAIDKLEDPTQMSNQVLRDFNEKLNEARNALASVQATNLRAQADVQTATTSLGDWEKRVNGLLDKIDGGDATPETATLAKTAAGKYHEAEQSLAKKQGIAQHTQEQVDAMSSTVEHLEESIESAKDQAHDIASRQKVADATLTINKALSSTNTDGLQAILNGMAEKVATKEFAGQAWASTSNGGTAAQKIDKMLGSSSADDTLANFRNKRAVSRLKMLS